MYTGVTAWRPQLNANHTKKRNETSPNVNRGTTTNSSRYKDNNNNQENILVDRPHIDCMCDGAWTVCLPADEVGFAL